MSAVVLPLSPPRPSASHAVALWLAVRTAVWTAAAVALPNPPLDAVEWLAWGKQWQAGYHKHPPLAAWLAQLASLATPGSFAGPYLLGYLCVALALWCVWLVARDLLPPRAALASTLCLDGLTYLGRDAAEFNNQVVLVAFWALAVWCCWNAARRDRWGWWAATGASLGLAMWCKYTAVFLALSLGAFWLWHAPRRWPRALVVAGVCAAVFLPHVVWLVRHDFPTLRYASERAAGDGPSRLSALVFVATQAARLLPVALVLLPLLARRRAGRVEGRSFLLFAVLGPVLMHLAAALAVGAQLRDIWGVPLWSFVGVLACSFAAGEVSDRAWRLSLRLWAAVALGSLLVATVADRAGPVFRGRPTRVHYPGKRLADEVTARWRDEFRCPLPVAAGDWWLAANVCVHADGPTLYGSREPASAGMAVRRDPARYYAPDPRASPWMDDDTFRRRGGVLLWDADTFGDGLPPGLRERFGEARERPPLLLPWAEGRDLRVGHAFVPPRGCAR